MKKILKIIGVSIFALLLIGRGFYAFYFLRSPQRIIPDNDELFVSPANGKIIAIIPFDENLKKTELYKKHNVVLDDWTKGFSSGATLISIMMTPLDVHYQKAPLESTLIDTYYEKGRFLNAMRKGKNMNSTFQNEYLSSLYKTPENYQFRIIQIAGFVARRIVSYLQPEQTVKQGEIIGLIKLWSQVSVVLDHNFEVLAQIGDRVVDGETILARKLPQEVAESN